MKLKDLIKNYRSFSPDQNWAKKSEAQLLAYFREKIGSQKKPVVGLFFYFKPVFISLIALSIIVSGSVKVFAEVKNSLPGQTLYPVKRLAEEMIYKLVPNEKKIVLKAEMAKNRLEEVKKIAEKTKLKDSEVPPQVKEATREFEKEIVALKKEIKKEKVSQLDLPVLDDKKIIEMNKNEDLEKLLLETKEALKEKNLTTALEKIAEFEKIFLEPEPQEEKNVVEEKLEETKIETEKQTPQIKQIKVQVDFKTDLIKE